MARSKATRERLHRQVLELRDRINLVDRALVEEQDNAQLLRNLAHCRATLNGLLTDVTQSSYRFRKSGKRRLKPTSGPRWKAAAARFQE